MPDNYRYFSSILWKHLEVHVPFLFLANFPFAKKCKLQESSFQKLSSNQAKTFLQENNTAKNTVTLAIHVKTLWKV